MRQFSLGLRAPLLSFGCMICTAVIATMMLASCGGQTKMSSNSPASSPAPAGPPPNASAACPTVTVAEAQGPMTGTAAFPPAAPSAPPAGDSSAGSVCVSTPDNGASVTSPAHVYAQASLTNPIAFTRVYVDGAPEYFTFYNTVDALMWMSAGTHTLDVVATDSSGKNARTTFQVNVSSVSTAPITQIQTSAWQPCSAKFPPGDPRAGQICAAGNGDAVSSMILNQSSPSMSGSSSKFTMGGPTPYTNELYTKFLGGGSSVSKFTYDLYFMIDQPDRPQALEFDVNQTLGNTRWVFGTECNFKADGVWDVWDGVKGWQPTTVPCKPFPANTWIHLIWTFERVGQQVHYVSVSVAGQVYPLNLYYSNQPTWTMQDIDVAFQMDGDSKQDPYSVWLDNVSLMAQ